MNFFDNCDNSTLELKYGIEVRDSLGYFSFQIPDSTWKPLRFLSEKENGLTVGDTSEGYMRFFNVNQSNYTEYWDWEEEQKNVELNFYVVESGEISLNGQKRKYNLVLHEEDSPQMISFYVTVLDTIRKRMYTLNLVTEYSEQYQTRICKMKPLMESFKIEN